MKYLIMLGDGMADLPLDELGGKTPLEVAHKPNMDRIASNGEFGLVKTVPDHLNPPGSDIANMSVLGYDPDIYYTGRSPIEAVSMGIDMEQDDVAIRCNLVTLSDTERYEDAVMVDYSSDEITTEESRVLIEYLNDKLGNEKLQLHAGISYRHCMIVKHVAEIDMKFTPPHDISTRPIAEYLPGGSQGAELFELMKRSRELLKYHPVNKARIERGLHPATSIWLWGQGRKPGLSDFGKIFGLRGAVISAVDLVKGLGLCAGMDVPSVDGATGNLNTNFEGKAKAAIDFLRDGGDLVYLHVEAPDECGHRHEVVNKVKAIEEIDRRILAPVMNAMAEMGDYKVMLLPDHPTPLALRTHTHDAVPFAIYDSRRAIDNSLSYDEASAAATKLYIERGCELMKHFTAKSL